MKYIDAEKLITEIERLYYGEAPKHDQQCDFDDGYFTGIAVISGLIDSLQQEQLAQKEQMLKDNPVIMPVEDFQALIDSHAKRVEADYKEKMFQGAEECMVMDFSSNLPRPQVDILLDPGKYHSGDKVKVIVIKEDEK